MADLKMTLVCSLMFLKAFEKVLVDDMTSVESEVDIDGSPDSALLQDYNTCGYVLAAVRDIIRELSDGK